MSPYNQKKIAIIGLSTEGLDTALFFAKSGARITCFDKRSKEELGASYDTLCAITDHFQLGERYLSGLDSFDIIVRTPGMALRTPQLVEAKSKGVTITSLTKLFFEHCAAPIIGVTGTKGKGTTSTLIWEMLKQSGKRAWLGGNVGVPLLSKVYDIAPGDIVVLELSSFQLEDLTQSPHIAVVLKITQEHLANQDPLAGNYHESREAYVEAKTSIVSHLKDDDIVVYNADDPTSTSLAASVKARHYTFSRSQASVDAYVHDGTVFLQWASEVHRICDSSEIHLIGAHNLENIAAASLVSALAGASIPSIRQAALQFTGLEYRLEYVRSVRGVSYYNDSFSTVPETAIAAIQSFDQPILLIVGGSEKGSDYSELGREIARSSVKQLIVIGEMTSRITEAVKKAGYAGGIITGLSTMHEIVLRCAKEAIEGDVVLLSPACASFDMFKNYKERGRLFKKEVCEL